MQPPKGSPCTACRRRRVRCSRTQPICAACLTYRKARPTHLCVFPPAPPPRSTLRRSERVALNVVVPPHRNKLKKEVSTAAAPRREPDEAAAGRAVRTVFVGIEVATSSKRSLSPGKAGQVAKVDSSATTVEQPVPAPPVALPPSLVLPPLPTFPSSLSQHVSPLPADVWFPPVAHRYAAPSALPRAAAGPPPPSRPALTAKQYSLSQHSLGSGTVAPCSPSPHALEEPLWSLASLLN